MAKFTMTVNFELEHENKLSSFEKSELRIFVMDALECWGGQRHPHDWLFRSLNNVKVLNLEERKKK